MAETGHSPAPGHLAAALLDGVRAGQPPHLLLMHLAMQASDETSARAAFDSAVEHATMREAAALGELAALWRRSPGAFALVCDVLARAGHDQGPSDPDTALAGWRATFDALAREQPEAGVALYSLADPVLLAEASREVVGALRAWGDVRAGDAVLDLGCGIGRIAIPLAEAGAFVMGIDISHGMLVEARRRAGACPRVALARLSGRDLAALADAAFDLALAIDVFPYLVQAGGHLAETHLREIARVLRPGGRLVLANLSYRGDAAADACDLATWASDAGLRPLAPPAQPFALWDGLVFRFERGAGSR